MPSSPEGHRPSGLVLCMMRKMMVSQRAVEPPRVRPRNNGATEGKAVQPPSSPRGTRLPQSITLVLSTLVLVLLWQGIVVVFNQPVWLLPGPLAVMSRFQEVWSDGSLLQHVLPTLIASVGGFGLALIVGSTLGYIVAHSRQLERWLAPHLAAMQAIPVIAVAPLIIIWFGYSADIYRNIVVAAIVVFFPIFSSTITGIRGIPRELREVGLVEGATWPQQLRFIELPLALPVLFAGFRTSLAYATTGAVVGEFIGSRYGLGALISIARGFFDTPLIFVALLSLVALTLLFYSVLLGLERLLLRWRDEA